MIKTKNSGILVLGANGFTGRFVCKELKKNNIKFTALLRHGNDPFWMKANKIKYVFSDIDNFEDLNSALKGFETIINIASLGFGSAPIIVSACENNFIKRAIFISTTGIFTKLSPSSKAIRIKAEKIIQQSNLVWTIIRPTMIYGDRGDRNIIKLIKFIYYFPIVPIFGRGKALLQPLNVNDLAKALVLIIDKEVTFYKVYNLSGATSLSLLSLINLIAKNLNKKIVSIHIPEFLIINFLKITEKFNFQFPIKREQAERLLENKDFSHQEAKIDFNFNPLTIEYGIRKEVRIFLESRKIKK